MNTAEHEARGGAVSAGLSRRGFVKALMGASAMSVAALDRVSASVYESLDALNQQYLLDPSPDGAYWEFLKGFLGWRRQGSTKELKLFWIPIPVDRADEESPGREKNRQ